MLKLLAVSDITSPSLENMIVSSAAKLAGIDSIISCGDLESEYLEFLVDGLNKDFYFVSGNHPVERQQEEDNFLGIDNIIGTQTLAAKKVNVVAGQQDMHGRIEVLQDYLLVGFGGSIWYGGRGNELTESEMQKVVKSVERKLQVVKLKDRILGRKPKEIIVISHTPPKNIHDLKDIAHSGFKCFVDFIFKNKPLLWMHGHVHLQDSFSNQITVAGRTTVLNVYGHKFIKIDNDKIEVSPRYEIFDK